MLLKDNESDFQPSCNFNEDPYINPDDLRLDHKTSTIETQSVENLLTNQSQGTPLLMDKYNKQIID